MENKKIVILVGCEESQTICKAFRERGFEAYSCDTQECSGGHPEWHLQMDVFKAIELKKPTVGIFNPPCTFISNAGARWLYKGGILNEERYSKELIKNEPKQVDVTDLQWYHQEQLNHVFNLTKNH